MQFFKRYQREISTFILIGLLQSFVFDVFAAYANPIQLRPTAYFYEPMDVEEERLLSKNTATNDTVNLDDVVSIVASSSVQLADEVEEQIDDQTEEVLVEEEIRKEKRAEAQTPVFRSTVDRAGESVVLYAADLPYGVIGKSADLPYDDPEDNLFKVNIPEAIDAQATYVLSYELYGASSSTAVAKSINTTTSTGGYIQSKNQAWTRVEEYIAPYNLKQGVNTVLFTAGEQPESPYLVRNLQIEKRLAQETEGILQVNATLCDSITGQVYVSGVIAAIQGVELYISGKRIPIIHDTFEYLETTEDSLATPLLAEVKKEGRIVATQEIHRLTTCVLAEVKPLTTAFERREFAVQKQGESQVFQHDQVEIELPSASFKEDFTLSIQELRPRDYAPTGMALVNVTPEKSAYRLLPDGIQFDQAVTLRLPYDATALPRGYSAKDIQVFYFDTTIKQWTKVQVIDVLEESQQVVALTTHFTDYVAGVILEPESPDGDAFAPTTLSGIQAVNPTENIPMVSIPQINDRGDAALTFPLILPQGRQGMTPDLSVNYNSGSDEGDFGLGWSLSVPTISVDTRWGVPLYDTAKETESYLLNGEELLLVKSDRTMYVPHKDPLINRVSNAMFHKAQHNPNQVIKRLGTVNNYTWLIEDRSTGWTSYFDLYAKGKWHLTKVMDPFDNYMQYDYSQNSSGDYQLQQIVYNKNPILSTSGTNLHEFTVLITRKNTIDIPSGPRLDVKTNNRYGVEAKSVDLIDRILISMEVKASQMQSDEGRKSLGYAYNEYQFFYKAGQFGRSLLYRIINTNSNNKNVLGPTTDNTPPTVEEYTFDYHDDIGTGSLFESTGQTINTYKDYATDYDRYNVYLSALGGTEGKLTNFNGGGSAGIVTPIFPNSWLPFSRAATIGGTFGGGSSNAEIKVMMTDIDGDGLPDKVFKDGIKFYYRKNLGNNFSADVYPIKDLPNLGYSRSENSDKGLSVNIFVGNISRTNSKSSSKTTTYMTDVNADGLLDVVDNERVYFGSIDPQTQAPSYSLDSSISPVIILKEEEVAPVLNPIPQVDMTNGPMDVVMVWRAPKPGQIRVTGTIEKQHIGLESGVKFSIERLHETNMEAASFVVGPNLMLSSIETHSHTLTVEKGELLFFRVHTNQVPIAELGISWNPKVEYTGVNPDPMSYSSRHTSSYADGFIVGSKLELMFKEAGKYRLEWPSFTVQENDRVTLRVSYFKKGTTVGGNVAILGNDVVIYEKTSNIEGVTTFSSPNQLLDMETITSVPSSFHYIKVEVLSDSEIDWKSIDTKFKPKLVSLDSANPDLYITPYYSNYSKVHTSNIPLEYTAEGPRVSVTIRNNFRLPECTEAACQDRYVYLVARNPNGSIISLVSTRNPNDPKGYVKFRYKFDASGTIVQKQRLMSNNRYENLGDTDSFSLTPRVGARYYFEYYTTEHKIGELVDAYQSGDNEPLIKVTASGANPSSYMSGVDTNGKVKANVYTSESTEAWGAMYRNWGQFAYKGAEPQATYQPIIGRHVLPSAVASNSTVNNMLTDTTLTLDQVELDMDNIQNAAGNMSEYFAMLLPNKESNRWESHEHLYVSATAISPYTRFLTDDIPDLRPPAVAVGNYGAAGITKYSHFKNNTTNKSLGFLGFSIGRADTKGSSELLNEFLDINGDGFPDIIGERIQVTAKRGGLSSRIVQADFTVRTSIAGSGTLAGGGNAGITGSPKLGDRSTRSANFMAGLNTKIGNQASGSLNGSKFTTNNSSSRFYVDINGDGLIDIVQSDGKVLLNYGGVFQQSSIWQGLPLQKSKTETIGGSGSGSLNLGFSSQSNLDIAAGLSISTSTSKDAVTYIDLNGDGLPEKIVDGQYYINTGMGFESSGRSLPGSQTQKSIDAGLNGNLTICVYFPIPIILTGPKFCVSVGAASGRNISTEESRYMDFDGDGFIDYVTSTRNESITVYKSRIRRTNLLKTVTQSTGAKIDLDYDVVNPIDQSVIGSTYKMPYKKWALTKVNVFDGFEGDGENTTRYAYEYFNGYKDRKERNFLGFGQTKAHLLNREGIPFRTTVTAYLLDAMTENELYQPGTSSSLKQYLYKKGLPKRTYTLDKRKRPLTETTYTYKFYDSRLLVDDIHTATTSSAEVSVFTEKLAVLPIVTSIQTKNWTYQDETGSNALVNQTQQDFQLYDTMGNVKRYMDIDRGLTVDIAYNLGVKTLPISHRVSVTTNNQQLRLTTATVTPDAMKYAQVNHYVTDADFTITKYEYDILGNISKRTLPGGFSYTYDYGPFSPQMGNREYHGDYFKVVPARITDPFGNVTRQLVNVFGQPVLVRDVYGEEIHCDYDPFNRLLQVKGPYEAEWTIRNTYGTNRTSMTQHNLGDGHILHTSMLTDGLGRVIQVKKQLANDEEYIGCEGGTPKLRFAVSGKTKYDEFGRAVENYLSEEELYCEPLDLEELGLEGLAEAEVFQRLLTRYYPTTDIDERKILTTYDDQDRVLDQLIYGIDAITKYSYGFEGNLMFQKVILPEGNTTINYFDKLGQTVIQSQLGDRQTLSTEFVYDALGQVRQVTNAMDHFTKYDYDWLGRVIEKWSSASGITAFTYDDLGQIKTKVDATGQTINYTYDFNRLTKIVGNQIDADFVYEPQGRLKLMTDRSGTHQFKYGKLGEVVEETKFISDEHGRPHYFKTKYKYDSWGRILELVYPDKEKVNYHYNSVGQLTSMINDEGVEYLSQVKYNYFDQPYYIQYGNKVEMKQEFDLTERLRAAQFAAPQANNSNSFSVFLRNVYRYDRNNNVKGIYNNFSQHRRLNIGGTYRKKFEYDAFNRLKTAAGKWDGLLEEHNYMLDMHYTKDHAISKKTQLHAVIDKNTRQITYTENSIKRNYIYEDSRSPQLTRIEGMSDNGNGFEQRFSYTATGNIDVIETSGNTSSAVAYQNRSFNWDANNNITDITDDGNLSSIYLYDGKGERVGKRITVSSNLNINGRMNLHGSYNAGEVLYPNGYLVYTKGTYTKHYYANAKRIASRIGKAEDVEDFSREDYNTVEVSPPTFMRGQMRSATAQLTRGVRNYEIFNTTQISEAICKNQVEFLLHSLYNTPEKLYCRQQILAILEQHILYRERCNLWDSQGNCVSYETIVGRTDYCAALEQINAEGCVELTADGLVIDPETGYVYDPITGIPLDPITRDPIDLGTVVDFNRLELDCYNQFLNFIEYYKDREDKPEIYDLLFKYYLCLICKDADCKKCYDLPGIVFAGEDGGEDISWIRTEGGFYIQFCDLEIPSKPREEPEEEEEEPEFPPIVLPPGINDQWRDEPPTQVPIVANPMEEHGPVWWYHSDHLGSTSYITDIFGKPVQYIEYLPFGEVMVEQSTNNILENVYKFNSKELDAQTGYYYYGARYYDPGTSIFLSVDPLAEQFPAWNPYHYVHNNPINLIDPTGMRAEETGGEGGRITVWTVYPDNNKKGRYNAYEVTSTDWEGDPTDVFSVHNNDGSIDIYNSIKDLNKAGITNVNYQRKNDKSFMGNFRMAYDGWVNPTGETARAKETMLNYIGGIVSSVIPVEGLLLGNTAKGGAKLINKFSSGIIDDAVSYAMKNKVPHIFGKAAHNLDPLVTKLGGYENTFRAVLNAANGKFPTSGVFKDLSVNVGGYNVLLRGNVVNGVPKIGTMFIP
ncbi:RHS repeat-associated core domain-containing protein [Myroides sp. C8-3]|uniref:RHS repeat-associated core domain-containing protein n=1 Tax=Myroides sp. C8-3 TaxID=3400533 RepID=UPI003D2F7F1A